MGKLSVHQTCLPAVFPEASKAHDSIPTAPDAGGACIWENVSTTRSNPKIWALTSFLPPSAALHWCHKVSYRENGHLLLLCPAPRRRATPQRHGLLGCHGHSEGLPSIAATLTSTRLISGALAKISHGLVPLQSIIGSSASSIGDPGAVS